MVARYCVLHLCPKGPKLLYALDLLWIGGGKRRNDGRLRATSAMRLFTLSELKAIRQMNYTRLISHFYRHDIKSITRCSLLGSKLVGHMIETLATDDFPCGLRCLENEKCLSYNSQSDGNQGNRTCELSDHTRQTSPDNLLRTPGFTYYGKLGTTKVIIISIINTTYSASTWTRYTTKNYFE